jgi:hypothetical protein
MLVLVIRENAGARVSHCRWPVIQRAAGSDAALLLQIMFYHRVFAPLRDPIIDQLGTRTSDHVAAPG